jgi:hypothetical protein
VAMERPPLPDEVLLCPSREDFARAYYAQIPVSYVSNHLLQLSYYTAKYLTIAQTCREREVRGTNTLVVLLRVRRVRRHIGSP